jgi:hypothetical protein
MSDAEHYALIEKLGDEDRELRRDAAEALLRSLLTTHSEKPPIAALEEALRMPTR